MSTPTSALPSQRPNGSVWLSVLCAATVALSWLLVPLLPLLVAGQFDWVMGYIYGGVLLASALAGRVVVTRIHPDLAAERAAFSTHENVSPWDRMLVALTQNILPLIAWIVAGLDKRFGWSPPLGWIVPAAALIVMVAGHLLSTWAVVVNRFFSSVVRIQADRGHTVITDGPYHVMRHPAYCGWIASWLAMPFLLGTLWSLIPAGIICTLTVARTALEDRTLLAELAGYAEYAQQTRYRLLPGVW